ncbi:hypothetical protein [Arthrobacter sp. Br18]|uniref:hypothetical protein n=1 Tax=Arthrobacter sp. Br18 TaxID=1312954 RepID=UPI00047D9326|nr:hypothetical protein [Arthrobacter sp. Br18]
MGTGWHGIPPSADRFVAPVGLPKPAPGEVTEPLKALPVWAEVTYADGVGATVKGFAMAWTSAAVLLQWVEYSRARETWVPATVCRRRVLESRNTRAA